MNPVSLCEDGFRLVTSADRGNVSVRKPTVPMLQAAVGSIFPRSIRVVFGLGANAKVRGVDARRIVASVHNHFIIGNQPNVKLIRIPMSANRLFPGKQKDAVPVLVARTFPFPAAACFVKTAFKNIIWAKNRIFRKAVSGSCSRVAASAQLSRYSFFVSTLNARKLDRRPVSHKLPPMLQFYDINEVLANVV
jgi:hypothetical protein